MVSISVLIFLLALLIPLPPKPPDDSDAAVARRLNTFVPRDHSYWGHD